MNSCPSLSYILYKLRAFEKPAVVYAVLPDKSASAKYVRERGIVLENSSFSVRSNLNIVSLLGVKYSPKYSKMNDVSENKGPSWVSNIYAKNCNKSNLIISFMEMLACGPKPCCVIISPYI